MLLIKTFRLDLKLCARPIIVKRRYLHNKTLWTTERHVTTLTIKNKSFKELRFMHLARILQVISRPNTALISKKTLYQWKISTQLIVTKHVSSQIFYIYPAGDVVKDLPTSKKGEIQGLKSLMGSEYALLLQKSIHGHFYRDFLTIIASKVVYYFLKNKEVGEITRQDILNIFSSIEPFLSSHKNEKFMRDTKDSTSSYIQHFCSFFWGNKTFTYNALKNVSSELNIHSYKNTRISILSFIEATFAHERRSITKNPKQLWHLINHENAANTGGPKFSPGQSIIQTGQPFADIIVSNADETKELIYIDVKSYMTLSLEVNRFSHFHPTRENLPRYLNDLHLAFNNFSRINNLSENQILKDFLDRIKRTKVNFKNLTFQEKTSSFNNLITDLIIYFHSTSARFAGGTALEKETILEFTLVFQEHIQKTISKNTAFDFTIAFPKTRFIHNGEHATFWQKFIETFYSGTLKDLLLKNLNTLIKEIENAA